MSLAWEVTNDDILQVLEKHGVPFSEEIADLVDTDEVEAAVLSYVNFDNQVQASLCEIEDQLLSHGAIKGEKAYNPPDDDDDDDDLDELDDDEDMDDDEDFEDDLDDDDLDDDDEDFDEDEDFEDDDE